MDTHANTLTPAAPVPCDDFDDAELVDRVIRGALIKCVDGRWTCDGAPIEPTDKRFLVSGVKKVVQRWQNQTVLEQIILQPGEPLPDLEELNAKVPKEQWELSLDGETKRPPYQLNFAVHLLDPNTAEMFTAINSTFGMKIAYEKLTEQVKFMRTLRNARVVPVITLSTAIMKTKFGTKMRPAFHVVEWVQLGAPQVAPPDAKLIGTVKPLTTEEIIDDEIPF